MDIAHRDLKVTVYSFFFVELYFSVVNIFLTFMLGVEYKQNCIKKTEKGI